MWSSSLKRGCPGTRTFLVSVLPFRVNVVVHNLQVVLEVGHPLWRATPGREVRCLSLIDDRCMIIQQALHHLGCQRDVVRCHPYRTWRCCHRVGIVQILHCGNLVGHQHRRCTLCLIGTDLSDHLVQHVVGGSSISSSKCHEALHVVGLVRHVLIQGVVDRARLLIAFALRFATFGRRRACYRGSSAFALSFALAFGTNCIIAPVSHLSTSSA